MLDKSITSIRRYEAGGLLHPGVDANGVHWFDRGEVERLGRKLRRSLPREVTISANEGRRVAAQLGLPWPFSGAQLVHAAEQLRARARSLAAHRTTAADVRLVG